MHTDLALGIEGGTVTGGTCSVPVSARSARCRGRARSTAPATSPTPSSGSPSRRTTGAAGSPAPASRTTGSAPTSSARPCTIKGLTFMPTGATVAALTTSLPETPGGQRNWDYRYTWMRDSTFTLQALHFLNLDWEAEEFMQFVADLEPNEDGSLQIMYGIDGRCDLTEPTLGPPHRVRGCEPGPGGQRRVRPTAERRVRSSPELDPPPRPPQPTTATAALAARRVAGGVRDPRVAAARPGDLGGAGRAPALRLVQDHVLGRARPRRRAGGDPRRRGTAGPLGRPWPRRSTRTSWPTG